MATYIVVKMFTTIGSKSLLVNLLRNMLRISQDISEKLGKILGIVPRKFPGIGSKELFSEKFPGIREEKFLR